MTRLNHRRLVAAAAAALLIVVTLPGCGSDGGDRAAEPTRTATVEATSEPTALPEPTTEPPPTMTPTPDTSAASVGCEAVTVGTGETTIPGERCASDELVSPRPAVIVLNGCGGYESDTEITAALVRALAERGVVALRIDYLAAEPAPPDTYCEAGPVIGAAQPLLQAVVDGVATLRADPSVDPDRIGTAAYSLGAVAAMAAEIGGGGLTTVEPIGLSVAALLSYPDQLPTVPAAARAGQLPPLLLMTGEDDTTAPPSDANALADAATEGGTPVDVILVPGQEHPWRGEAALTAAAVIADYVATQLDA
jgi:dienelactone hydrolase